MIVMDMLVKFKQKLCNGYFTMNTVSNVIQCLSYIWCNLCSTGATRQPWVFCGGGSFLGLLIVLADQYLTKTPSIQVRSIQSS